MEKVRVLLGLIESLRAWKRKVELIESQSCSSWMSGSVAVFGNLTIGISTYNGNKVEVPNDIQDLVCDHLMQSLNTAGILAAFDRAIARCEGDLRWERESISPETRDLMRELLGDQAAKTGADVDGPGGP